MLVRAYVLLHTDGYGARQGSRCFPNRELVESHVLCDAAAAAAAAAPAARDDKAWHELPRLEWANIEPPSNILKTCTLPFFVCRRPCFAPV
jgi:hypothetical protein